MWKRKWGCTHWSHLQPSHMQRRTCKSPCMNTITARGWNCQKCLESRHNQDFVSCSHRSIVSRQSWLAITGHCLLCAGWAGCFIYDRGGPPKGCWIPAPISPQLVVKQHLEDGRLAIPGLWHLLVSVNMASGIPGLCSY